MFMITLGRLHREEAEHRPKPRQSASFQPRAWKSYSMLPRPRVTLRQRPRHHQCQTHLGQRPCELGWSLPFSQEGFSWPLYSNAPQVEDEVSGFFFPGNTQNFVHWKQLVPAICRAALCTGRCSGTETTRLPYLRGRAKPWSDPDLIESWQLFTSPRI